MKSPTKIRVKKDVDQSTPDNKEILQCFRDNKDKFHDFAKAFQEIQNHSGTVAACSYWDGVINAHAHSHIMQMALKIYFKAMIETADWTIKKSV